MPAECTDENCKICQEAKKNAVAPPNTGNLNLQDLLDSAVPFVPRGGPAKLRLAKFLKALEAEREATIKSLKETEDFVENVKQVNSDLAKQNTAYEGKVTQLTSQLLHAQGKTINGALSADCVSGKHVNGNCSKQCQCGCHAVFKELHSAGWQTGEGVISNFADVINYAKENKLPLASIPRVLVWEPK